MNLSVGRILLRVMPSSSSYLERLRLWNALVAPPPPPPFLPIGFDRDSAVEGEVMEDLECLVVGDGCCLCGVWSPAAEFIWFIAPVVGDVCATPGEVTLDGEDIHDGFLHLT